MALVELEHFQQGRGESEHAAADLRDQLAQGPVVDALDHAAVGEIMIAQELGPCDEQRPVREEQFAAAFLGATTIFPGRFNPIGSIAAVYFLVTGITGLQLLGLQTFVQQLFYGGALILAVALSQFARRRYARQID